MPSSTTKMILSILGIGLVSSLTFAFSLGASHYALASHVKNEDIHPSKSVIEARLQSIEATQNRLDTRTQERWREQRTVNEKVLERLNQIKGKLDEQDRIGH